MTAVKFVLAAALWVTTVTFDKQIIHTPDGIEISWSASISQSEAFAGFENNHR